MNGIHDFAPGGYPLPYNPVTMGDYVPGGFPLPWNPVQPSAKGSLPKAPGIPRAMIGNGGTSAGQPYAPSSGCGCCGMGKLTSDTLIPQASLPTFLQGDAYIAGFPTVYLFGGVLVAAVVAFSGGGGRRRR